MDIEIVINPKLEEGYIDAFNKSTKKTESQPIIDALDLNGWYLYTQKIAFVNVGSLDFQKLKSEKKLIDFFIECTIHESLHHAIDNVIGFKPTKGEENMVKYLSGETKCLK